MEHIVNVVLSSYYHRAAPAKTHLLTAHPCLLITAQIKSPDIYNGRGAGSATGRLCLDSISLGGYKPLMGVWLGYRSSLLSTGAG